MGNCLASFLEFVGATKSKELELRTNLGKEPLVSSKKINILAFPLNYLTRRIRYNMLSIELNYSFCLSVSLKDRFQ